MAAQFLEPLWLDAGNGPGKEPRGLDHFAGDHPARCLVLVASFVFFSSFFLVALEESRSGEDHHFAVAGGLIDIAFFLAGDVREKPGEHRAMNRIVVGGFFVETEAAYFG